MGTLCLTRRLNERILVFAPGANIITDKPLLTIEVVDIDANKIRLGMDAGIEYAIVREEVVERIRSGQPPHEGASDEQA